MYRRIRAVTYQAQMHTSQEPSAVTCSVCTIIIASGPVHLTAAHVILPESVLADGTDQQHA